MESEKKSSGVHIGSVGGDAIGVGVQGSHNIIGKNINSRNNTPDLKDIISELKREFPGLPLTPDQKNDLQAEIQTVEGQMSSSKPKTKIIIESLSSAKSILEGAASVAAAAAPIITKIGMWLHGA